MTKENPISILEDRKAFLSNLIGQRTSTMNAIGGETAEIKISTSLDDADRAGEMRKLVAGTIKIFNNKLANVNQELEVYKTASNYLENLESTKRKLDKIDQLVAEGYLKEEEVKVHFDKFKELESLPEKDPALKKAIENITQREKSEDKVEKTEVKPAAIEAKKSIPTLEIDRKTGDVTIIEGEKIRSITFKGNKTAALQVLLALAEKPNQPTNSKTITEIVFKTDFHDLGRPAGGNIDLIRKKFGQTKDTFPYISSNKHGGKEVNYTLNANVIFVGEEINNKPAPEENTKKTRPTAKEINKQIIPIKQIALDKENLMFSINGEKAKISKRELLIVSALYDKLNQKIPASELSKILVDANVKSILGWVIADIEHKFDGRIFTRTSTGARKGYLWSLDTVKDAKSIEEKRLPLTENVNPDILTEEEVKFAISLIGAKENTKVVFDKNNEVIVKSPTWIGQSDQAYPNNVYDNKDLPQIRKIILGKIREIIQKDRNKEQTISKQPLESAGLLLVWIDDNKNLPEGIRTENKAFTLDGLINFLLSNGTNKEEIVHADKDLSVIDHAIIYNVPEKDVENIGSKKIIGAEIPAKAQETVIFKENPVVQPSDEVLSSTPEVDENIKQTSPIVPAETANEKDNKETKWEKLYAQATVHIEKIREELGPSFWKKEGFLETQIPELPLGIKKRDIEKNFQNGSIEAVKHVGNKFIRLEEIVLLAILKDDPNLNKNKLKQLRKIVKSQLRAISAESLNQAFKKA